MSEIDLNQSGSHTFHSEPPVLGVPFLLAPHWGMSFVIAANENEPMLLTVLEEEMAATVFFADMVFDDPLFVQYDRFDDLFGKIV